MANISAYPKNNDTASASANYKAKHDATTRDHARDNAMYQSKSVANDTIKYTHKTNHDENG